MNNIQCRLKTAAFSDWQYKLKRGDTLPRGKYFEGKKAGRTFCIDEYSQYNARPTNKLIPPQNH